MGGVEPTRNEHKTLNARTHYDSMLWLAQANGRKLEVALPDGHPSGLTSAEASPFASYATG